MIYKSGKFKGHEINNRNWRKDAYNRWIVETAEKFESLLAKKREEKGEEFCDKDIADAKKAASDYYSELLHGDEATVTECRRWIR